MVSKRLAWIYLSPLLLLSAGTTGYVIIEGWPVADAVYMTVITLSTVGFQEVHPLSPSGRDFTVILVLGGVFAFFYVAGEAMRAIFGGEVQKLLGRQRMEKSLQALDGHLIVCGYGRVGKLVCREFSSHGLPFVVMDQEAGVFDGFALPHGLAVPGDATDDDDLKRVGIARARGLVSAVASDAENAYIVMSARFLRPDLYIVARAEDAAAEKKLQRAGASRVINPYQIGSQRVAHAMLRPAVIDFIDLATSPDHLAIQIEEISVGAGSFLAGAQLSESGLRREHGIILVAVKRSDGRTLFNPAGDLVIEAGDVLIGLGSREQLDRLESKSQGIDRPTGGKD